MVSDIGGYVGLFLGVAYLAKTYIGFQFTFMPSKYVHLAILQVRFHNFEIMRFQKLKHFRNTRSRRFIRIESQKVRPCYHWLN